MYVFYLWSEISLCWLCVWTALFCRDLPGWILRLAIRAKKAMRRNETVHFMLYAYNIQYATKDAKIVPAGKFRDDVKITSNKEKKGLPELP